MFNAQEFPQVFSGLTPYVRVSRYIEGVPGAMSSIVTSEDVCIEIACAVERMLPRLPGLGLEIKNDEHVVEIVRAIVWTMISNHTEAGNFAERYAKSIRAILN